MPEEIPIPCKAMINVMMTGVEDEKVIDIKRKMEALLADYPETVFDVRLGTGRPSRMPPNGA